MHSILARANSLFAFTLWVMAAVTASCFISAAFLDYSTPAEVVVHDVKLRPIMDYSTDQETVDLATMQFSVKADFTKVFNWNVKQLFVYLVAEYASKDNAVNQVVLWDRIVERADRVVVDQKDLKTKYYFMDDGKNLINHQNITLVLRYNVVPNAGYLRLSQAASQVVAKFPAEYTTKRR